MMMPKHRESGVSKRTWTQADIDAALAESTVRSGVPLHVEDPVVLDKAAVLFDVPAAKDDD
jgi:hypothetical protein